MTKISRYPYRCRKGHEVQIAFAEPPDSMNCQEVVGAGAFCMAFAERVRDTADVEQGRRNDIIGDSPTESERPGHVDRSNMRPPKQGEPKYADESD